MTEQSNWTLLYVGVAFVALVLVCGALVVTVSAGVLFFGEEIMQAVSRSPRVQPYGELPEPLPQSDMPPIGTLDEQFAAIETIVVDVRNLPLEEAVPQNLLTGDELSEIVVEDFLVEYTPEDAADDAVILAAFDVVPITYDLYEFYRRFYTEGIAGFYDPEEEAFYIISADDNLAPEEEITYAHELTHVLQAQHFDLNDFMNYGDDRWFIDNADAAAARQAVIEGDATLTERLYEQNYLLPERREQLYEAYAEMDLSFFQDIPLFMLNELIFPYQQGYTFVEAVYRTGGFAAVDALYADPPTSTEQIHHPDKYLTDRDEPQEVTLVEAEAVLPGYREVITSQLGEFGLRNFLQQEGFLRASAGADGWDGYRYSVYFNDEARDVVLIVRIVWDDSAEAEEFRTVFATYASSWSGTEDPALATGDLTCWQAGGLLCSASTGDT
ncbi:MAG: hypothetical protein ACFB51_09225, partial [Anaerolineae bacterium]